MFAGRKTESSVWNCFEYKLDEDKSICLAKSPKNDDACGFKLSGKKSTNLKLLRSEFSRCVDFYQQVDGIGCTNP